MQREPNKAKGLTGRREFIKSAGAVAAGMYLAGSKSPAKAQGTATAARPETLALFGGPRAVAGDGFQATEAALPWPLYNEVEQKEIMEWLKAPNYETIDRLEATWAEYHQQPLCKAFCNGTAALMAQYFALDLPPGSEVLVPDLSTIFPVVPMRFFGLVPVFVDSQPRTSNLDIQDCKKRLTKYTKAIMPVHWFGLPCDMDDICDFAKEHDLAVLEDASHSHGAKLKGQLMGTWGRMAGISLQMGKLIPSGEGGMGMYKNRNDYERAVILGNYDKAKNFPPESPYRKYTGTWLGFKQRMHPMAAILGRIQLEKLDEHNKMGAAQIKNLNDRLSQLPGLSATYVRPDIERVYYSNLLVLDPVKAGISREAMLKALQAEGVKASTKFAGPVQSTGPAWDLLHNGQLYKEPQWWHHLPPDPGPLPGCEEAVRNSFYLKYFTIPVPDLCDQYVKAFEKVWAHRKELT